MAGQNWSNPEETYEQAAPSDSTPTQVTAGGATSGLQQTDPTLHPNQQDPAALLAPESAPEHHKAASARFPTPSVPTSPAGTSPEDPTITQAKQDAAEYEANLAQVTSSTAPQPL